MLGSNQEEVFLGRDFAQEKSYSEETAGIIDEEIKKQFTEAMNILRKNKADVIGIHNKFFRDNRKAYKKFIKDIKSKDDFLDYVNFKINLELKSD